MLTLIFLLLSSFYGDMCSLYKYVKQFHYVFSQTLNYIQVFLSHHLTHAMYRHKPWQNIWDKNKFSNCSHFSYCSCCAPQWFFLVQSFIKMPNKSSLLIQLSVCLCVHVPILVSGPRRMDRTRS